MKNINYDQNQRPTKMPSRNNKIILKFEIKPLKYGGNSGNLAVDWWLSCRFGVW